MDCALTCSMVPSVPFFTPSPRSFCRNMTRSPLAKFLRAAFDRQPHVIAQITGSSHPLPRSLVEDADLVVGVGQDDPAPVGGGLPVAVPAVDQIAARLLAGLGLMHHALGAIGFQRNTDFARRQIARGVALPVIPLTANLADFGAAMALMDRAERRASFDGLQLLADRRLAQPLRQPRRHGTARAPTGACRPCPPRRSPGHRAR